MPAAADHTHLLEYLRRALTPPAAALAASPEHDDLIGTYIAKLGRIPHFLCEAILDPHTAGGQWALRRDANHRPAGPSGYPHSIIDCLATIQLTAAVPSSIEDLLMAVREARIIDRFDAGVLLTILMRLAYAHAGTRLPISRCHIELLLHAIALQTDFATFAGRLRNVTRMITRKNAPDTPTLLRLYTPSEDPLQTFRQQSEVGHKLLTKLSHVDYHFEAPLLEALLQIFSDETAIKNDLVWRRFADQDMPPSTRAFEILASRVHHFGYIERAVGFSAALRKAGRAFTAPMLSHIAGALANCNQIDQAVELVESHPGIQITAAAGQELIHAHVRGGFLQEALCTYQDMCDAHGSVPEATYICLINAALDPARGEARLQGIGFVTVLLTRAASQRLVSLTLLMTALRAAARAHTPDDTHTAPFVAFLYDGQSAPCGFPGLDAVLDTIKDTEIRCFATIGIRNQIQRMPGVPLPPRLATRLLACM
jgi:hypothetical protein